MMNLFKYKYKKYSKIYKFFESNQELFNKTKNGEQPTNQHLTNLRMIQDKFDVKFPYGKCFPISQFMFWYLGGYESRYILKCIKKIPIEINEYPFYTSHWFVHEPISNTIIDLSKHQFDKILDIEALYQDGRRANYGFKWFRKIPNKRYSYVVPCKQVLKLYHKYRQEIAIVEHLEYFYERMPYDFN